MNALSDVGLAVAVCVLEGEGLDGAREVDTFADDEVGGVVELGRGRVVGAPDDAGAVADEGAVGEESAAGRIGRDGDLKGDGGLGGGLDCRQRQAGCKQCRAIGDGDAVDLHRAGDKRAILGRGIDEQSSNRAAGAGVGDGDEVGDAVAGLEEAAVEVGGNLGYGTEVGRRGRDDEHRSGIVCLRRTGVVGERAARHLDGGEDRLVEDQGCVGRVGGDGGLEGQRDRCPRVHTAERRGGGCAPADGAGGLVEGSALPDHDVGEEAIEGIGHEHVGERGAGAGSEGDGVFEAVERLDVLAVEVNDRLGRQGEFGEEDGDERGVVDGGGGGVVGDRGTAARIGERGLVAVDGSADGSVWHGDLHRELHLRSDSDAGEGGRSRRVPGNGAGGDAAAARGHGACCQRCGECVCDDNPLCRGEAAVADRNRIPERIAGLDEAAVKVFDDLVGTAEVSEGIDDDGGGVVGRGRHGVVGHLGREAGHLNEGLIGDDGAIGQAGSDRRTQDECAADSGRERADGPDRSGADERAAHNGHVGELGGDRVANHDALRRLGASVGDGDGVFDGVALLNRAAVEVGNDLGGGVEAGLRNHVEDGGVVIAEAVCSVVGGHLCGTGRGDEGLVGDGGGVDRSRLDPGAETYGHGTGWTSRNAREGRRRRAAPGDGVGGEGTAVENGDVVERGDGNRVTHHHVGGRSVTRVGHDNGVENGVAGLEDAVAILVENRLGAGREIGRRGDREGGGIVCRGGGRVVCGLRGCEARRRELRLVGDDGSVGQICVDLCNHLKVDSAADGNAVERRGRRAVPGHDATAEQAALGRRDEGQVGGERVGHDG